MLTFINFYFKQDLIRCNVRCSHVLMHVLSFVQVVGAPIAAGLLHLDGSADLRGWQWLFLVEGMPTTILGLLLSILLPPSPRSARCLTPTEAETVEKELTACRSIEGSSQQINSAFVQLNSALMNWPMYVLGLVKFGKDFTSYGCMFWAPMLIRGLLHKHQENGDGCTAWESPENDSPETGYKEVLLTAIPYSLAAVSSILVAWNSQVRVPLTVKTLKALLALLLGLVQLRCAPLSCVLLQIANRTGTDKLSVLYAENRRQEMAHQYELRTGCNDARSFACSQRPQHSGWLHSTHARDRVFPLCKRHSVGACQC